MMMTATAAAGAVTTDIAAGAIGITAGATGTITMAAIAVTTAIDETVPVPSPDPREDGGTGSRAI